MIRRELLSNLSFYAMVVIFVQILVCATIIFDIQVLRQIIGFIYLSFVPGFIALRLLKIKSLNAVESILFSLGFSLSFLMIICLLLNYLLPGFGIARPLETTPVLIATSVFVIGGILWDWLFNNENLTAYSPDEERPSYFSLSNLLFLILPILSMAGALWSNDCGNSSLLLFTLLATAVSFVVLLLFPSSEGSYRNEFAIFSIAITILFHVTFASNYLSGHDIHLEYYVFKQTLDASFWDSTAFSTNLLYGTYNNMASITLLPTAFANILNVEGTFIFKVVYLVLFAFVPVGVYSLWKQKLGSRVALFSALFFMSQYTFYFEMPGLARQMVAELFFVLLFSILLSKKFNSRSMTISFVIFSFSLILSHYSLALIFLVFISSYWVVVRLSNNRTQNVSLPLILFFFVAMFVWYSFTSNAASFKTILSFVDRVYYGLGDFLDPTARGADVLRGIGLEAAQFPLQWVSRIVAYTTQGLIVLGFLAVIAKWYKKEICRHYLGYSSLAMVMLILSILLPNFAESLQVTRIYHVALFFLAPFMLLACKTLVGFVVKHNKQFFSYSLVTIVLVTYFLFQTNIAYEVTGSPSWSVPLSQYRMDDSTYYDMGFVHDHDVLGARWVSQYCFNQQNVTRLFVDGLSQNRFLTSYGLVYRDDVEILHNFLAYTPNKIIYLNRLNVLHNEFSIRFQEPLNTTTLGAVIDSMNKVYSNGANEVYIDAVIGQ